MYGMTPNPLPHWKQKAGSWGFPFLPMPCLHAHLPRKRRSSSWGVVWVEGHFGSSVSAWGLTCPTTSDCCPGCDRGSRGGASFLFSRDVCCAVPSMAIGDDCPWPHGQLCSRQPHVVRCSPWAVGPLWQCPHLLSGHGLPSEGRANHRGVHPLSTSVCSGRAQGQVHGGPPVSLC